MSLGGEFAKYSLFELSGLGGVDCTERVKRILINGDNVIIINVPQSSSCLSELVRGGSHLV